MTQLDREAMARQSYGRALAEARRAPTSRAWARLLRAARNLRWIREERARNRRPYAAPERKHRDGGLRRSPPTRLLVVEDDHALREALVELLEGAGYRIDAATDGREALAALAQADGRPEVVILDLDLPVVSGWAVRERMLSDPALARVPVIVLTGSSGDPPPAVHRVPKPFEVHDLVRAVEQTAAAR